MTIEWQEVTDSITKSTEFSQKGMWEHALDILDYSIAKAIKDNYVRGVQTLSRHAAIIAELNGDLNRARFYNEQTLKYEPDNSMALYGLAKIHSQLGEVALAKEYAARCYDVSLRGGTEIDQACVELLGKHWPEYGEWRARE